VTAEQIILESDALCVVVDTVIGGTITSIVHKPTGASVLGTVPWTPRPGPAETHAAPNENAWLPYYSGGWPILFPNGGDACTFDGVFHGFHGEASLAPWDAEQAGGRLRLHRRFATAPVEMEREFTVEGEALTIRERVTMRGDSTISVMWGHHPTFGSDLLDGPFVIGTSARRVFVDDRFDLPLNPLRPGATGDWPNVPGKAGRYDLSRPRAPMAAMAYLADFESPSAWIRRLDDTIAAILSWDGSVFPYAWLWCELGATQDAPWGGRAHLIGIEPNTTWPGNGLLDTHRRGAPHLSLRPAEKAETWVSLEVTRPTAGHPTPSNGRRRLD
jgi:galactose mutarotase-like enzyme